MANEKKVKKLLATIKGDPLQQHSVTIIDGRGEMPDILHSFFVEEIDHDIVIEIIDNKEQVDS